MVCLFTMLSTCPFHIEGQGRLCLDNFTCCNTAGRFRSNYLIQSQKTRSNTTAAGPSTNPITPGVWQKAIRLSLSTFVVELHLGRVSNLSPTVSYKLIGFVFIPHVIRYENNNRQTMWMMKQNKKPKPLNAQKQMHVKK